MRRLQKLAVALSIFFIATSVASADTPERSQANDATLTARVKAALAADSAVEARQIEVETRDGVVQLSGFVDSEDTRSAAVLRARSVDGVAEVRNDLSLRTDDRSAAQPVADTVIAARVRNRLNEAELEDARDVNIEVSDGVVQLSGFLMSVDEKARAGDLASAVEGVRDVENQIALTNERERLPE